MEDAGYLFDNASGETPTRFAGLEGLWDESTIRYLSKVGVGPGWKCWEVGAGGGSIARWLAERVAPTGTVLATDLDLTRIPNGSLSNLAFVRHDVVHDPIPTAEYDLVHARLVLVHLPEREEVLRALARSLRPSGSVLIEDFDFVVQDGWEPDDARRSVVSPCASRPAGTSSPARRRYSLRVSVAAVASIGGPYRCFG